MESFQQSVVKFEIFSTVIFPVKNPKEILRDCIDERKNKANKKGKNRSKSFSKLSKMCLTKLSRNNVDNHVKQS